MANLARTVFLVSDSTGITTESFSHSLLSQFAHIEFNFVHMRYVDSMSKAREAAAQIAAAGKEQEARPLVFSTLVDAELRRVIAASGGAWYDLFETYLAPLQQELQMEPRHVSGRTHGVIDDRFYTARIDAVNFSLQNDDGVSTRHYSEADIILVGVSRTGKTPTCLYLALHYGVYAANFPITEDDCLALRLPAALQRHREKLFGLTIDAERLQRIRSQRRADSRYASLSQCRREIQLAEELFAATRIPYLDTTTMSVEEIATTILNRSGLRKEARPAPAGS